MPGQSGPMHAHDVKAALADRARLGWAPGDTLKYRLLKALWGRAKRAKDTRVRMAPRADGLVMEVDRADIIDFTLWWFGRWEPMMETLIARHLRVGDVAVDIGANIGAHTLTMARAVGREGAVHAMEPGPLTHQRLARNVALNNLSQVVLHAMAAGEKDGVVMLYRGPDGTRGRASVVQDDTRVAECEIKMVRACDLQPEAQWARTRLIKIDVELAEAQVLRGLHPIANVLPQDAALLIEASPRELAAMGEAPFKNLLAPFNARGWRAYAFDNRADLRFMLSHTAFALHAVDPDALARTTDIAVMAPETAAALIA
jgi:FkbM family methyltransferase